MSKLFCFIGSLFIAIVLSPAIGFSAKPLPPLNISITPVQPGITSDQIRPGDTVEFKIAAVSLTDVQEMQIEIELTGGARLLSGNRRWTGPAGKNDEKVLLVTVQASEKGRSDIKARASIPSSNGSQFSVEAQYELGAREKVKPQREGVHKKDKKGRDIIEYR